MKSPSHSALPASARGWAWALALWTLLSAGAGLRLWQLDAKGLWSDELYSASIVQYRPLLPQGDAPLYRRIALHEVADNDTFWTAKAADQTPPLFELSAKAAWRLIGSGSGVAMRAVSVLAGILCLMYLAQRAWRGRASQQRHGPDPGRDPCLGQSRVMALLLLLTASSATLVEYAQEARAYSLGALFATVFCVRLYDRLRHGLARAALPGGVELLLFVLACYTHYNMLVLGGLLLMVYGGVALGRREWRALARMALVPLAVAPWLYLNAHTILRTSSGGFAWDRRTGLLASLQDTMGWWPELLGSGFIEATALTCMLSAALWVWQRRQRAAPAAPGRPIASAASAAPVAVYVGVLLLYLVAMALVSRSSGIFSPRHLLFVLPMVYLPIALLLSRLWARHALLGVACAALLAGTQIAPLKGNYAATKEGYREVLRAASLWLEPGAVVVTTWWPNRNYYRFYLEGMGKPLQQWSLSDPGEAAALCQRLAGQRAFALVGNIWHQGAVDALRSTCGARYEIHQVGFHHLVGQYWVRR